ncbi:MAG: apolipoprotein N-acyltransferase [Oscillatoriales cyanobacterium C42_A2020_001]|nr:apolipoprotein N-acyltransferase [Leptolyngbyaceae cyanobacterium C42_A2020_001]
MLDARTTFFQKVGLLMLQSGLPLLVSFVSGILMSLAAAPLNGWWLAWFALAPLWVIAREPGEPGRRLKRSKLVCAVAWGVGYHGLTLWWILGLHPLMWLGVPWLASVAIALFCWAFITLWGTTTTVLWVWVMARWGGVLVGTALWCGLEFVLSLTPLSWTSLSFTQSPGNLVILHLGRLSGPLMVTAAIVAVNGFLAEAWRSYQHTDRKSLRTSSQSRSIGGALIAALLIGLTAHLIGFSFYSQPLNDSASNAFKIGIVQGNIPTREKLSERGVQRAIRGYVGGYEALADQGADAVLTPEGALPFLWDPARNPLRQAVIEKGVAAWLGSFFPEDGRISQSLLAIDKNGEVVGRYNKIKLVPLGEYIPFQETLGALIGRLSPIKSSMVPGRADQRFETPFGRAIASICYESVFPELFRAQAAAGGEFILTASNLDPYSEVLMAQHQAQDLMRAVETDRWAARATNTGYSGIIDPHGNVVWRSQPYTYQIHAAAIYRRQTHTPYVRWGDWLTPLLIGVATLRGVIQRFRKI